MRDQIEKALQALKDHFGTAIFTNPQQFKSALADTPIENDAKKIRHLLNVAMRDMKAYARLKSDLANNPFLVDNLIAEMSADYDINTDSSRAVIECIAELLGHKVKPPAQQKSSKQPNIVTIQQNPQIQSTTSTANKALMKRSWLFLEDADWKQASEYFNKVLDTDPEYAPAYIGLLCAELQIKDEADLANHKEPLDNMPNYKKAIRFADTNYQARITGYNQTIKDRIAEEKRLEQERIQQEQKRRVEEEQRERERLAEQKRIEQERMQQEQKRRAEEERRERERLEETERQKRIEQEHIQQEQKRRAEEGQRERERIFKKSIENIKKWQDEVNHRQEQSRKWKSQKLCPHCGVSKIGFFSSICKTCGKEASKPVYVPDQPNIGSIGLYPVRYTQLSGVP